ncbi:MAG: hypothetical protein J7578_09015 [Chitinophagaceae bacterium]|nr:hypothetical protein [Chitinophagaceae bacterium]
MKSFLKLSLLAGIMLFAATACQKSNDLATTGPVLKASASIDTSSPVVKLLVDSVWYYYEYYSYPNSLSATLVWKANKPNNTLDLSLNKVTYFNDGTYTERDQYGNVFNGTWELLNNETQIRVYNSYGTFTSTIKKLNNKEFEWQDSNNVTYGIMRHVFPGIDTSVSATTLLTSQEWKYDAYYSNYNANSAYVDYKTGKSNNAKAMSNMRVKFNTDGTYYEVDQSGNYLYGTWALSGTTFTVYNSFGIGVYASTINVLTTDRFEWKSHWTDTGGPFYGELVH